MAELIFSIESVVALPAFQAHVRQWSPDIASIEKGARGVFFGYDFHLGEGEPQLIEINTNAGGALLNAHLVRTLGLQQGTPCADADGVLSSQERTFLEMFFEEWRLQRGDAPLRGIAIVDETPEEQFLYPEFELFAALFRRAGVHAVVVDPAALEYHDEALWCGEQKIDLVYNRLTDFSLEKPFSTALRMAYLEDKVVLTPHPRAHAMYADKRILAVLSDESLLSSWEVPKTLRDVLRTGIPRTTLVNAENSESLWERRRKLFFKPAAGFGSKGAYRGDKLTRRVWQEILNATYVAQEFVPPSVRSILVAGQATELKVDVRNYVYDGKVQLMSARMFQGQTTNFRTPGGGFAVVVALANGSGLAPSH
ncbi:hypothetical protein GJ699_08655 [Duganella sp. FT80W]|uniref:Uncharacterized protein n=1 Tax=Duganella guangzhouensis TaxID=2666084 RepID=A0A6I2KWZ2_9BURK|nr:hypothetical protein [Duganella guangzhouensis]MRW90050.1 hypothetical protein [Duganella guangzhouensis]